MSYIASLKFKQTMFLKTYIFIEAHRIINKHAISRFFLFCLLFTVALTIHSCFSVKYSMSGASIPPEVKTLSVQYFPNRALIVNPSLSQKFTDALREKCRSQTNLIILTEGGDVSFEGEITGYESSAPVGIQGNDQSAKNRFTVTIHVKFVNSVDPKLSFDSNFSRYQDFESTKNFMEVESQLLEPIIEELTEDIFNKAFVNW
jgi:hypothetical protein